MKRLFLRVLAVAALLCAGCMPSLNLSAQVPGKAGTAASVPPRHLAALGGGVAVVEAPAGGGLTFGGSATASAALLVPAWATSTSYVAGQVVQANGNVFLCTTGGSSASSGSGPTGTGTNIADGAAVWTGFAGSGFRGILITDTDSSNPIYIGLASTITAGGVTSGEWVAAGGSITWPAGLNVTQLRVVAGATVAFTAAFTN